MGSITRKIIIFVALLISVSSILQWTILPITNTSIWWLIYALIIGLAIKALNLYDKINNPNFLYVKIYLVWNVICIIRGVFIAEDYWEWKQLINTGMVLIIPIITYSASNSFYIQKFIKSWIIYVLPTFIFFSTFIEYGAYGRYLIPISFTLLFFPLLNTKWKIFHIIALLFIIAIDLGARSNVIKFSIPLLLSFIYYFKSFFVFKLLHIARILLLCAPFLFLTLGITGTFNIFKMTDYIEGEYKVRSNAEWEGDGDLTVDTRTFIYVEVISSSIKYNYELLGRTPARGNESATFGPKIDKELNRNKNERFSNEVGIANIFTWTGLIGVFLNFMIFVKATYMGLKKSRSWSIKILAIYVSFRWFYSWVEDFSRFDLSTVFLWLCIAMCLSNSFRNMNDEEFKNWFRGIFDKRYSKYILKKQLVISEEKLH